ncbi:hypothetical protein [Psychromicrobium xiongbiense]|uniref:hypothetical protein n=1 Tax=Psychromicrobium xiongbiense TaxID=3051184 RepID=UPI003075C6E6
MYSDIGKHDVAVFDPGAGIRYPERNVRAQTAAAQALGADVYPFTRVTEIVFTEDGVRLRTPTVTFEARQPPA